MYSNGAPPLSWRSGEKRSKRNGREVESGGAKEPEERRWRGDEEQVRWRGGERIKKGEMMKEKGTERKKRGGDEQGGGESYFLCEGVVIYLV